MERFCAAGHVRLRASVHFEVLGDMWARICEWFFANEGVLDGSAWIWSSLCIRYKYSLRPSFFVLDARFLEYLSRCFRHSKHVQASLTA